MALPSAHSGSKCHPPASKLLRPPQLRLSVVGRSHPDPLSFT